MRVPSRGVRYFSAAAGEIANPPADRPIPDSTGCSGPHRYR
ncbi:hypothetical protein HMPREF3196_00156 [Bifidobacterium bifidum]|uniref:Uncharacterized protein n=1 Tax=Bifidobacterium bifidum TaxID=1681 RepID=A0A133KTK9_BIFBI|nr:hypothetical protein HMPREF3196_00156 [Bifidobacterium bifidum]